jgi:CheY-like chemotaxis protein
MVRRILVADDSSTIQKVIKIGLANLPNDIRSVSSLIEAMKFAQPGQFDLIIAGAGLPGVSAASDFKKLSEQAGGVPLIILMGSYDAVRETDLRAAGIQMIMKKPFPPGDLTRMVQDVVGDRESKDVITDARSDSNRNQSGWGSPGSQAPIQWDPPRFSSSGTDHSSIARSIPEAIPENLPFGSVSAFDLGSAPGANTDIPPVPEVEPSRKGRPAFDLGSADAQQSAPNSAVFSQSQPPKTDDPRRHNMPSQSSRNQVSGMSAAVEAFVLNELPPLVDRAVERYCIEHFKQVAREALTTELRRLAEEKARFLVDQ